MSATPTRPLPDPLPLFPLQTVLFPGALLGLKIFETRYLDLVSECLRSGQPFGVICLRQGAEAGRGKSPVQLEDVGVLAHIEEVDAEQPGILHLRCLGGQRFRLAGEATQRENGLWQAGVEWIEPDPPRQPGPAVRHTVDALAEQFGVTLQTVRRLSAVSTTPAGWPTAGANCCRCRWPRGRN